MSQPTSEQRPRILILTVHHGSAHVRVAQALEQALMQLRPSLEVEVVDVLAHCTPWFRAYYNSFVIQLTYWPALWEWIESAQHRGNSTEPAWLYRFGAKPLFRFIAAFAPDVVVATEVGLCEIAAMHKREHGIRYCLVGVDGFDADKPWAQPEVDLFPCDPGQPAAQLAAAGVPARKIFPCGVPVSPPPADLPDRAILRARLGVEPDVPLLLVNFGGLGRARPGRIVEELAKINSPLQVVFVTRRKPRLTAEVERLCKGWPRTRVFGWVDNMQEWMAAADLMLSRAGGATVAEALNAGLPILGFDPPPGDERRVCDLIEKSWQVGYWVKRPEDISARIGHLLASPKELERLRANALARARPRAAFAAAAAILQLAQSGN